MLQPLYSSINIQPFCYLKNHPFKTSSPLMRLDACGPSVGNRINGFIIVALTEGLYSVSPFIVINCKAIGAPIYGTKSSSNYNAGSTITFTCNAGYSLQGSASRTCRGGEWTGVHPKCPGTEFNWPLLFLDSGIMLHLQVHFKVNHQTHFNVKRFPKTLVLEQRHNKTHN